MSDGAVSVREYLADRERAATRGLQRGPAARVLRRLSPYAARQRAKLTATTVLAPVERRRARKLTAGRGELRLNLGSGPHPAPGWLNVDLVGMNPDLHWDLRRPLPFADTSAAAVFLEHVLEHFTLADGLTLLAECRRVLVPGGVIRVGVPDFGRYIESYAGDGEFVERLRPGRPTRLLAVAELAYGHGHRSVWDAETLERVLTESGFIEVGRRGWGESRFDPAPDTELRRQESVYAEALKP